MKTRVLAVLLAVCMIAGTCVLSASAATYEFKADTYVMKIDPNGDFTAGNLKQVKAGTDYNIPVTAEAKDDIELSSATKKIDASNVDSLVKFKKTGTTTTYSFKSELSKYIKITNGSFGGEDNKTASITFEEKVPENNVTVYKVNTAISTDDYSANVADNLSSTGVTARMYILTPSSVTAVVSKWTNKLSSVTMGVRFFGDTYNNLVASEIAKVTAVVERKSGATTTTNSSVTNVIKDLMIGDVLTLKAELKDPATESEFYGFYCWVDGSGNVLSTSPTITHTVDGSDVGFYATFVELKNRYTIDYKSNGNGKVVYTEGREVFSGDAQISVLEGRDATFTFVPDEGYEVAKVLIDGKTDIASFKTVALAKLLTGKLAALKTLINATNKDVYSYTFPKVMGDHTIEVTFMPIENFEVPSGKELPTIEAEGITLATGANGEGGEGGEGGGANGGTTVPAEGGAAGNGGSAVGGVVNPATGSTGAIAVFAALSVAAAAAFVTAKKKED